MPNSIIDKVGDSSQRYGWLINLIIMAVTFAYFMGILNQTVSDLRNQVVSMNQTITELKDRVTRLEGQMDALKTARATQ